MLVVLGLLTPGRWTIGIWEIWAGNSGVVRESNRCLSLIMGYSVMSKDMRHLYTKIDQAILDGCTSFCLGTEI